MADLDQLDAQLHALAEAVEADDFARADAVLADHAAQLAALDTGRLAPAQLTRLHALLHAQQQLLQRIGRRRDEAATHLRQGQRSLRAAHAYLQAESLA